MDIKSIINEAYDLMNEPVIDGNCGELCNYHCCRPFCDEGNKLGMYMLPFEFELIHKGKIKNYEIHTKQNYELPNGTKKLYYIFCEDDSSCLRELRPIQCRTYPFEPLLEDDELFLIIEDEQFHICPLLKMQENWRWEFVLGIYRGWSKLLEIPKIEKYVNESSVFLLKSNKKFEKYNYVSLEKKYKK